MQAHLEFSAQGFQYRENTVSLYVPYQVTFPNYLKHKKYACPDFMVMK